MTLVVVGLFERAELRLIVRRTLKQTGEYRLVSALGHWEHEAVRMPLKCANYELVTKLGFGVRAFRPDLTKSKEQLVKTITHAGDTVG